MFYFINDFEYSIMFSTNSDPAARLVVGPPGGLTTDEYNKPLGPEVFGTTPYCPFKMDVFQLGWTFSGLFGVRLISKIDLVPSDSRVLSTANQLTRARLQRSRRQHDCG